MHILSFSGFVISERILGNSDITLENSHIGNGSGYVDRIIFNITI